APLMAHSVRINMPQVSSEPIDHEPKSVDLAIDTAGALFWDDKPVAIDDLPNRFYTLAQTKPQPELRIRADLNTRYETLAKVMAAARRAGLSRIGFDTTPGADGNGPPGDEAAPGSPAPGSPPSGSGTPAPSAALAGDVAPAPAP